MSAALYRHTSGRLVTVDDSTRMAALMDRSPDWTEVDEPPTNPDEDEDEDDGRPADTAHFRTWAAYARSLGIDVPSGTSKVDVIAAVDAAVAAEAAATDQAAAEDETE